MTVRQFAKDRGFEIIGKLTYKGVDDEGFKMWIDEAGNEYYKGSKGFCIVDAEGGVW